MNYFQPNYGMPYMQPQYPMISGKIVDTFETAKGQDVPFGSFSVFPKADLSSIFVKSWNPNGTTELIEYQKTTQKIEEKQDYSEILSAIEELNKKIDGLTPVTTKKTGGAKNE